MPHRLRTSRPVRIAVVTAGLVLAGALLGAVAGGGAMAGGLALTGGWGEFAWGLVRVAAALGAVAGAVLGPACAWVLLRLVPLAPALAVPTLGTMVGGTAAWCAGTFPPFGALVGFAAAALGLRLLVDRRGYASARASADVASQLSGERGGDGAPPVLSTRDHLAAPDARG